MRRWFYGVALEGSRHERRPGWTESIAVGSESLLRGIKKRLWIRAKGRKVMEGESRFELRDGFAPYSHGFGDENVRLSEKNTFFWGQSFKKTSILAWPDPMLAVTIA